MPQLKSPLEIYKYLPKTNCRHCQLSSCLAFADAIIKGHKNFRDCPFLNKGIIEHLESSSVRAVTSERQQEQILEQFRNEIKTVNLSQAANKLGGTFSGATLKIKCLGKDFLIDSSGNIRSACHVNRWIIIPLIDYILYGKGKISGNWVPFRELRNAKTRQPFFEQRCEKPLQKIADADPELLFEYIIYVFGGKPVTEDISSNYAIVLYPLPKVPVLVKYSKFEDELYSQLNVFFDSSADENLSLESIYLLGVGMVTMFEKIGQRHGLRK